MPELVGSSDLEVPGPPAAALAADRLQQPMLAHQPLTALAIDRPARAPGSDRGDHPRSVGGVLVLTRHRQNDAVQLIQRAPVPARRATWAAVVGLAADPRDPGDQRDRTALRDQFAGSGDAQTHSQPRESSPATSTSIVLRPNARSSLATWPRSSSTSVRCFCPECRDATEMEVVSPRQSARHDIGRWFSVRCATLWRSRKRAEMRRLPPRG